MGIRGHGRPRKKKDPIIAAALPEVVQPEPEVVPTPAPEVKQDTFRKRKDRALSRASKFETVEEFWAALRQTLDPKVREQYLARQETAFDQMFFIEEHVKGVYDTTPDDADCYVSLEEGDKELRAFIKENGTCNLALMRSFGEFWKKPSALTMLTNKDEATKIMALYGIYVTVPNEHVKQWNEFLRQHWAQQQQPASQPQEQEYVVLQCRFCNKTTTPVHSTTAAAYNGDYRCEKCSNNDSITDGWGRVKDQ